MSTAFEPILKPSEYFRVAVTFIRNGMSLMVRGSPGMGKTQITRQACEHTGAEFIPVFLPIKDPTSLEGFPTLSVNPVTGVKEAEFLPFGDLKKILLAEREPHRPYVVFADDIGNAAKLLQASWMQFVCEREMNGHKIPPNVVFISATNKKDDKTGVTGIIESLKNKHHAIVELVSDLDDWCEWAINSRLIEMKVLYFVRFQPRVLRAFKPSPDITTTPTPRGLEHCSDIMRTGINGDLRGKLFAGAIGSEFAVQLEGYLRYFDDIPDPDSVIRNPEEAPIPDEPGHLYALCCALAERASEETIDGIIAYGNRLTEEFSIALVLDSVRRDKKQLAVGEQWIKWVSKHGDLLS